jgi:hypothetical protein
LDRGHPVGGLGDRDPEVREELRLLLGGMEALLRGLALALEELGLLLKDLREARRREGPESSGTRRGLRLPVY